jgi:hypothetical protein
MTTDALAYAVTGNDLFGVLDLAQRHTGRGDLFFFIGTCQRVA